MKKILTIILLTISLSNVFSQLDGCTVDIRVELGSPYTTFLVSPKVFEVKGVTIEPGQELNAEDEIANSASYEVGDIGISIDIGGSNIVLAADEILPDFGAASAQILNVQITNLKCPNACEITDIIINTNELVQTEPPIIPNYYVGDYYNINNNFLFSSSFSENSITLNWVIEDTTNTFEKYWDTFWIVQNAITDITVNCEETGECSVDASQTELGIIMNRPNGSCYRVVCKDNGDVVTEPYDCPFLTSTDLEFIDVMGGTFDMGCIAEQSDCDNDEFPVHSVTLSSFKLSKYEITNAQYAAFMNAVGVESNGVLNGINYIFLVASQIDYVAGTFVPKEGRENYPVIMVRWDGAQAYCNWAGGRLPTEAEWEYAARGGNLSKGYLYSGSNTANEVAWYDENSGGTNIQHVGTRNPNELGLYDMSGNVLELCSDWYNENYYNNSPTNNPQGPANGTDKVRRGGSTSRSALGIRVSERDQVPVNGASTGMGFRCAKDF